MKNQTVNFVVFIITIKEFLDTEAKRWLDDERYMPIALTVAFGILIGLGIVAWLHS